MPEPGSAQHSERTHNVFLSWAGPRSKAAAAAFHGWLRPTLQAARPWMSEADLPAGANWLQDLLGKLAETEFGVLFVTAESVQSSFLQFEAGILASRLGDGRRVCPLLFDFQRESDLAPPLSILQAKIANKAGVRSLLSSINDALRQKMSTDELSEIFEERWPKLERAFQQLPSSGRQPVKRPAEDILEEVLTAVRTTVYSAGLPLSQAIAAFGARRGEERPTLWLGDSLVFADNGERVPLGDASIQFKLLFPDKESCERAGHYFDQLDKKGSAARSAATAADRGRRSSGGRGRPRPR